MTFCISMYKLSAVTETCGGMEVFSSKYIGTMVFKGG